MTSQTVWQAASGELIMPVVVGRGILHRIMENLELVVFSLVVILPIADVRNKVTVMSDRHYPEEWILKS